MLLSIPRVWDTSQQAILPTLPQRRTGKIRKWVPASYACYSSFLSLLSLFPTTEKKLFCRTYPKEKRCNLKKRLQRFLKSIFNFAGHFHLSSFSTSLISFAVAVTIRIPLSLIVSSNVSSCRRCVFFVSGFSKRNWSTDIS